MTTEDTNANWINKPGPPTKSSTRVQISVTIAPEIFERLKVYMDNNGLNNRSHTIARLIEAALLPK